MKYTYFSYKSGFKGLADEKEFPRMIKQWEMGGGRVVVDEIHKSIVIYEKDETILYCNLCGDAKSAETNKRMLDTGICKKCIKEAGL